MSLFKNIFNYFFRNPCVFGHDNITDPENDWSYQTSWECSRCGERGSTNYTMYD